MLEIHLLAGFHPAAPPGPAPIARRLIGAARTCAVLRAVPRDQRCVAIATELARWYRGRPGAPDVDEKALAFGLAVPLPALAICADLLGYGTLQLACIFDVPEAVVRAALAEIVIPPTRSGEYVLALDIAAAR